MTLVIWTKDQQWKVSKALSALAHRLPPVQVVTDVLKLPQIEFGQPVLVLGEDPKRVLETHGVIQKKKTTSYLRNRVHNNPLVPGRYLFSYSVGVSEMDYRLYTDLLVDVMTAVRYAETGSMEAILGEYKYVQDLKGVIAEIEEQYALTGKPVDVSFDTETLGLDPYANAARFVSLQFTVKPKTAHVVYFYSQAHEVAKLQELHEDLLWILTTNKVSLKAANGKYDFGWLKKRTGIYCTNFKFDTTLVGSLLDENRSNGLDIHAKIYVPELAGYCVVPETRLWKSDLLWVAAGAVEVGDELVGFDEFPPIGVRRKLRQAQVLSKQELDLSCFALTFSDGRQVTASYNHAWLVHPGSKGGNLKWVSTQALELGTRMKVVTDVVEPRKDYWAGWMAGFLDGEGHVTSTKDCSRFRLGWAQLPGPVWNKATEIASTVVEHYSWNSSKSGVNQAQVATHAALKLLQAFRPIRLLGKDKWVGANLPQEPEHVTLIKKEFVGVRKVISLKTSTSTFVAEGLASHNSDEFDRTIDKSRMDLVPPEKLLPYAGGDTDATLRVALAERPLLLQDPQLTAFYIHVLHPAARAFETLEQTGVCIDQGRFNALEAELQHELLRLTTEAKAIIGGRLVAKHRDEDKIGGLNLTKASLLSDFMFSPYGLNLKPIMVTEKTKAPSTSMEHLQQFADVPEASAFVNLLGQFSSANKMLSTYITGFRKHLRDDGRFHPSYFLFVGDRDADEGGASTGRLSAKDPAIQTVPKRNKWGKKIRSCYVAPPGYLPVEADYAQGELKVVACVAGEPTMLKAYLGGLDMHLITSSKFVGLSLQEMEELQKVDPDRYEDIRRLGKAGNFGLLYGMGVDGFVVYAANNYGVKLPWNEAEAFRNGFFETYPGLIEYHAEYKAFAKRHGYVRSPLGRIRHLPLINSPRREVASKAERQSINSPIQGCLSDMLLMAFAEVEREKVSRGLDIQPFAAIHDAGYFYVREDRVPESVACIKDCMENLPLHKLGWYPQLKFTADAKVGPSLGELSKA